MGCGASSATERCKNDGILTSSRPILDINAPIPEVSPDNSPRIPPSASCRNGVSLGAGSDGSSPSGGIGG